MTLPRPTPAVRPPAASPGFAEVYRSRFLPCCRWLEAMGAPPGDAEDLAQEVFLVVRRRLDAVDGEAIANLDGWIYRVARNTFSDWRRRAWWRRFWSRRSTVSERDADPGESPLGRLERDQRARRVRALLDRLPREQRTALVLFEVLGHSGEEIAALEGVPVATVWTRLHNARKRFVALAAAEAPDLDEGAAGPGPDRGGASSPGPGPREGKPHPQEGRRWRG